MSGKWMALSAVGGQWFAARYGVPAPVYFDDWREAFDYAFEKASEGRTIYGRARTWAYGYRFYRQRPGRDLETAVAINCDWHPSPWATTMRERAQSTSSTPLEIIREDQLPEGLRG